MEKAILCQGGVALLLGGVFDTVGSFCTHQQILVSASIRSNQSCNFFLHAGTPPQCKKKNHTRAHTHTHIHMPWQPIWQQLNDTYLSYNRPL